MEINKQTEPRTEEDAPWMLQKRRFGCVCLSRDMSQ